MMNVITHTETRQGNTWIVYTDADTGNLNMLEEVEWVNPLNYGETVAQLIVPVISTTN